MDECEHGSMDGMCFVNECHHSPDLARMTDDGFDWDDATSGPETKDSSSFRFATAQFPGVCKWDFCDEAIEVGDLIKFTDDTWVGARHGH